MCKSVPIFVLAALAELAWAEGPKAPPLPASQPAVASTSQPATQPAALDPQTVLKALGARGGDVKPLVEKIDGGEIDWTKGELRAIGAAKLGGHQGKDFAMAQRAARLVAARNAILLMSGIRVGPGGRFQNVKEGQISIDAVLQDFKETDSDYDPKTESVISVMRIPFHGAKGLVRLHNLVLDKPGAGVFRWPNVHPAGARPRLIVIDARGCGLQACLLPQVVTETGTVVFSPADAGAEALAERGVAIYAAADAKADISDEGVVIVKAKVVSEKGPSTLILDKENLDKLTSQETSRWLMTTGRWVILTELPAAEQRKPETK